MSNKLVAYFSASGVTGSVAKKLAEASGADIYEIKPAVSYTSADLNWQNSNSRSSIEMKDKSSRPELADTNAKIEGHDVIFLGFPIWWYVAPTIINTFLEAYDFSGKKIILFATSGGSGFGNAVSGLQPSAPNAKIIEGKVFRRSVSVEELKKFAENF
ncbi:MAG: NAD(P)H-dependent oxidoreductase [Synergistaceae bacterium]|nr:NAD(P)H-dependent oxidoreductase [Synergistaceae bacterium]